MTRRTLLMAGSLAPALRFGIAAPDFRALLTGQIQIVEPFRRFPKIFKWIVDGKHDSARSQLLNRILQCASTKISAGGHVKILPQIVRQFLFGGNPARRLCDAMVDSPDRWRKTFAKMPQNNRELRIRVK